MLDSQWQRIALRGGRDVTAHRDHGFSSSRRHRENGDQVIRPKMEEPGFACRRIGCSRCLFHSSRCLLAVSMLCYAMLCYAMPFPLPIPNLSYPVPSCAMQASDGSFLEDSAPSRPVDRAPANSIQSSHTTSIQYNSVQISPVPFQPSPHSPAHALIYTHSMYAVQLFPQQSNKLPRKPQHSQPLDPSITTPTSNRSFPMQLIFRLRDSGT